MEYFSPRRQPAARGSCRRRSLRSSTHRKPEAALQVEGPSRRDLRLEGERLVGEGPRRQALEVQRGIRELFEREREEPGGGLPASSPEVDAGRRDLDQPLEVTAILSGGTEPDRLPLLVGLEEPAFAQGVEPSREAFRFGRRGFAQAFGRAERIRSSSAASTYPSILFTTFPDPSTKRMVG